MIKDENTTATPVEPTKDWNVPPTVRHNAATSATGKRDQKYRAVAANGYAIVFNDADDNR
jgi:hypothetical protein